MADGAAAAVPTFKLVLVGDGGTGKVCYMKLFELPPLALAGEFCSIPAMRSHSPWIN
jgi:hypothetical protein